METENNKEIIQVIVSPQLKTAYENWLKVAGYATMSEALREHMRNVTNFSAQSQENSQ